MNLGSIFGGIGNFLGSIFDPKKQQSNTPPAVVRPVVAAPTATRQSVIAPTIAIPHSLLPVGVSNPVGIPQLGGQNNASTPAQPTVAQPQALIPAMQSIVNDSVSSPHAKAAAANVIATQKNISAQTGLPYPGEPTGDVIANAFNSSPIGRAFNTAKGIAQSVPRTLLSIADTGASDVLGKDVPLDFSNNPLLQAITGTKSIGNIAESTDQTLGSVPIIGKNLQQLPDPVKAVIGAIGTALNLAPAAAPELGGAEDVLKAGETAGTDTLEGGVAEVPKSPPLEPDNPITKSPTTDKAPAITSSNQSVETAPVVTEPPATPVSTPLTLDTTPAPVETAPVENPEPVAPVDIPNLGGTTNNDLPQTREIPQYTSPVRNNKTASVAGTNSAKYTTGDDNLDNIVHDSIVANKIDTNAANPAKTAADRVASLDNVGINSAQRTAIRNIAVKNVDKTTGKISDAGVQQIKDVLTKPQTLNQATKAIADTQAAGNLVNSTKQVGDTLATAPEAGKLGTIAHNAVLDGSINTPKGVDQVVEDTTGAAKQAAADAGDTLPNIIAKGKAVAQASKDAGHDLSTDEVINGYKGSKGIVKVDPTFTPAQQKVYLDYKQELDTLRDRSGLSLHGGNQGKWYSPDQSLTEDGESQEFDPAFVNEEKRNGTIPAKSLDTSEVPYEHYIRRYANAPAQATGKLVDAVEKDAKTGADTGLKVPETAKEDLQKSMADIVAKRDEATKAASEGDVTGTKAINKSVEDDINQMFNKFADSVPKGAGRQNAINAIYANRDPYLQSSVEAAALSNVASRAADQGTVGVFKAQQPLVRGIQKIISPLIKSKAMEGTEANALNTTRNARIAANNIARGSKATEIANNFKANLSRAGAGRNPIVKGISKIDTFLRAVPTAGTQLGDLTPENIKSALQQGASLPEASGLKTVADYEKYFGEHMQTSQFQRELSNARATNNSRIGLGAADNAPSGKAATIATGIDNVVKNTAKVVDKSLGTNIANNRLVQEINDYVKTKITGFAGVGTRIAQTAGNAFAGGIPRVVQAVKIAGSGDPTAVAHATQMASQSITDAITAYGAAGAAAAVLKYSNGAIGYTGAPPVSGTSAAAYNKDHGIPANQWYLNFPNGSRIYINPARITGAAGLAADTIGSIATGGTPTTTAENLATQAFDQVGGSNLPETISDATTALSPTASASTKAYPLEDLQRTVAPSIGLLNNIANATDSTKRDPTNFTQDVNSGIPVLRAGVPVAKGSSGQPLPNTEQDSGGSSILSVAKNPNTPTSASAKAADPVAAEITRLHGLGIDITPTSSATNASNSNIEGLSKILLTDPLYQSSSDKDKAAMLNTVLKGTATKSINPTISAADQQALLTHTLLGTAKSSVWLDDNTNAANYYTADYDNQKANGTVDDSQDDLTNTSGLHYKAVQAQVNEKVGATYALEDSYKTTTQTDFQDMLDPKSTKYDPTTANQVYAYDQARAGAGLTPKYNLATAQAAIAKADGSGSAASKAFTFANLPASLSGADSSTADGTSYTKAAPLFTPIASLKTPATAIPKGRTISVSKGVN
jgi:hypothetical protein